MKQVKKNIQTPLVSVVSISYNQENFIKAALDGFVSQQTDFEFEVIIGDDASTDKTPELVKEYSDRYPNIFRPLLRKKNIGSQNNFIDVLQRAKGKYIALCEGDDYWTDPEKLQRQVDFLETHPDYAMCFHKVRVFFENNEQKDAIYPDVDADHKFTLEELLDHNYIQTNSAMYRRQDYKNIPNNILPLDWYIHLYHAQFGKIGFINRVMSAYRRHSGGMWWAQNREEFWIKHGIQQLHMYAETLKLYKDSPEHINIIYEPIGQAFRALAGLSVQKQEGQDVLSEALASFPELAAGSMRRSERNRVELENRAADYKQRIDTLEKHAQNQQNHIEELERLIAELHKKLQEITDSRAWKTIAHAKQVKAKLKRRNS